MSLRWGLLSTARINRRLIAAVEASERSEIRAIGSRTAASSRAFAEEWDVPVAHGSYASLLADPSVDAVYIPLPNHMHAEWAVRALEAGKHVLCEKPIALTLDGFDRMAAAARKSGCHLAEAFMYRHHPRTRRVRAMIGEGAIGTLRMGSGSFSFLLDREGNYRLDPRMGGGALWDVGCYPVSFARYVIGSEPIDLQSASTMGPSGTDVRTAGILTFPDGVLFSFDCAFDAPFRSEVSFEGSAGRLVVPLAFQPGRAAEIHISTYDGERVERVEGFEPLFLGEVQDMERVILDGASPEIPLVESRGNTATLQGLQSAARKT